MADFPAPSRTYDLAQSMVWDNDLHPEPRQLAARIARIERHLGLDAHSLMQLDPPETWR